MAAWVAFHEHSAFVKSSHKTRCQHCSSSPLFNMNKDSATCLNPHLLSKYLVLPPVPLELNCPANTATDGSTPAGMLGTAHDIKAAFEKIPEFSHWSNKGWKTWASGNSGWDTSFPQSTLTGASLLGLCRRARQRWCVMTWTPLH